MILAGRYDLVRSLGRGGMGQVWEARDTVLDRRVAVKTVHIGASDPTLAARFRREAVATAALSHPDIVTVHDAGLVPDDDGAGSTAFLVMEFLPGRDLAAILRDRGALPQPEALHVGERVADALAAAHAIGVVHRDVKPANVLVDGARVTVVDFGIAALTRSAETALTAPGSTLGTAEYMAPEQASGAPVSPAADVYSLGCLLFALLTGTPPFTAEHPVAVLRGHVDDAAPSLAERLPEAPADLVRLLDTMLAKDPAARPRASEVRDALARVGGGRLASSAPGVGPGADADRPTTALPAADGTRALPAVGAAAAAGLGAGAGLSSGAAGAGAPSHQPAGATARFEADAAPSSSSHSNPDRSAGQGAADDRGDDGTSWRALPILVAGIAAVTLIAVGLGTLFRPDPVPPGPPRVESSTSVGPIPTPAPTPTPALALPAPAPQDLDEAMVALLSAIEAIDTETRESLAARTDLLSRWERLDQAIDDGRDRQVQTRLRDLSRRAEAVVREESITPAEAAALTAAIEDVDAAVAAQGDDAGDD